jgi:SDR family mycofactocin-dependent oxidoreductase
MVMGKLSGKVALITGAARGQGRAHAVRLAHDGADIIACDIAADIDTVPYGLASEDDLLETARLVEVADRRCVALRADARRASEMQNVVERGVAELGGIDIVVVNHGICAPASYDASEQTINDIIDVNLKGAIMTVRAAVPRLVEQERGGSIILTSSSSALKPVYGLAVYVATKAGVIGLMQALAAELAPHNIRVNAICPGTVETPMVVNDRILSLFSGMESGGTFETAELGLRSLSLLPQPWVSAEDVAGTVSWLASEDARCVTGVTVPVDLGTAVQPAGIPPIAVQIVASRTTGSYAVAAPLPAR